MNIWDYIKSINNKDYIWDERLSDKEYNKYIVNMAFSYYPDTIFFANELNKYPDMSNKQHYDFLYFGIPKRNRWSKWLKSLEKKDIIAELAFHYNVSYNEMIKIMKIVKTEELKEMITIIGSKGGNK